MDILNIVATAVTTKPFDLNKLQRALKGSEKATSGANWLKMRLPETGKYVAFYKSGKFLITGVKSLIELDSIVNNVRTMLSNCDIEVLIKEVKIHNVVVSDNINIRCSLEKIILNNNNIFAYYEPERFPGMVIHGDDCTYLLFSSGRVICLGNESIEIAKKNVEWIKRYIGAVDDGNKKNYGNM